MGWFDRQVNFSFKRDAEGRTVFFPHGAFGAGRILPNAASEQRARRLLSVSLHAGAAAVITAAYFFGWRGALAAGLVTTLLAHAATAFVAGGLPRSSLELTLREGWARVADEQGEISLWILLIVFAIACTVLGFTAVLARDLGDRVAGAGGFVVTGAVCASLVYSLRLKLRKTRA